jgi:hypothetical protein
MKKKHALINLCLFLVIGLSSCKNDPQQQNQSTIDSINSLLAQKDFFTAKTLLDSAQQQLPEKEQWLFEAHVSSALNEPAHSNELIGKLVNRYASAFTDSVMEALSSLQLSNHVRLFEYEKAHAVGERILANYSAFLTPEQTEEYKNTNKIWKALALQPKQTATIVDDTQLQLTRDKAGLRNLPVSVGNTRFDFIFDTGANFSVTTQTTATKMGMELLEGEIEVKAITGVKVKSRVGVCKSMAMGNATIEHAVFLVMPDSALAFPQINYQIHGIIGFPVIEAMKEITVTRKDEFIIRKTAVTTKGNPFALDFLTPIIQLDEEHYTFDTGAGATILYPRYFHKRKDSITAHHKEVPITFGGAGGNISVKGYYVTFAPTMGSVKVPIDSVQVVTSSFNEKSNLYYGNIGNDLIHRFNAMTINFDRMVVDFQ